MDENAKLGFCEPSRRGTFVERILGGLIRLSLQRGERQEWEEQSGESHESS